MTLYLIKNKEKKSVFVNETWTNEDGAERFIIEEMYRWGETIISVDEEEMEMFNDTKDSGEFCVTEFAIEDQDLIDGCSLDFNTNGNQELYEKIEALWNEDSYAALEDAGYYLEDSETYYVGDLEITEVS
jgi:hypothetical protein